MKLGCYIDIIFKKIFDMLLKTHVLAIDTHIIIYFFIKHIFINGQNKANTEQNKANTEQNNANTEQNKANTGQNNANTEQNKANKELLHMQKVLLHMRKVLLHIKKVHFLANTELLHSELYNKFQIPRCGI